MPSDEKPKKSLLSRIPFRSIGEAALISGVGTGMGYLAGHAGTAALLRTKAIRSRLQAMSPEDFAKFKQLATIAATTTGTAAGSVAALARQAKMAKDVAKKKELDREKVAAVFRSICA